MPIVEIYRVRVDPANVGRLLEIHDEAVAEYQEHKHVYQNLSPAAWDQFGLQ